MLRTTAAIFAFAGLLPLAACSTSPLSSIGAITGSNKVSETDRVFLMAAGSWDRNRDNSVTCDEWKAYASELFNAADADRDDGLSTTEWSEMVKTDRMFQTVDHDYFDANNDGKVSRAEFVDRQNPAFKLMDTANTCVLSGDQIAGARSKTEYDTSGKKPESGDPREKTGSDKVLSQ
ncbi:MAG: histidine kinase [Hyphomicrobium sp.]|jgi:hypothetical protein|nr:histidine kinase [Hyphomicrobium sp.]